MRDFRPQILPQRLYLKISDAANDTRVQQWLGHKAETLRRTRKRYSAATDADKSDAFVCVC